MKNVVDRAVPEGRVDLGENQAGLMESPVGRVDQVEQTSRAGPVVLVAARAPEAEVEE